MNIQNDSNLRGDHIIQLSSAEVKMIVTALEKQFNSNRETAYRLRDFPETKKVFDDLTEDMKGLILRLKKYR